MPFKCYKRWFIIYVIIIIKRWSRGFKYRLDLSTRKANYQQHQTLQRLKDEENFINFRHLSDHIPHLNESSSFSLNVFSSSYDWRFVLLNWFNFSYQIYFRVSLIFGASTSHASSLRNHLLSFLNVRKLGMRKIVNIILVCMNSVDYGLFT